MALTKAQRMARQNTQWPWEEHRGKIAMLPPGGLRRRAAAARLALLFEAAAFDVGAWVSTEAVIRVQRRPETVLRPVLAVVTGEPSYDGVIDDVPLLVIDSGPQRRHLWPQGAAATLWTIYDNGVAVDGAGGASVFVPTGKSLFAAGLPALRVDVGVLCDMARGGRPTGPSVSPRPREEATAGHPH